ncbi:MAG: translation initiation factor IF-2 subunit beta [archaeon]|nr:translation initiation factor IF-2 subunit beta [archaeon]
MEDYETLLSEAYKNVKKQEECGRFEIKRVEGHIEGNKTIISNFVSIAGCLRRQPEHLAKFLFKELASSGQIIGERLVLIRKISSKIIDEKIEKYVNSFVLCSNCKKPDTEFFEENGQKYMKCMACGTKKPIVNKL